MRFWFSVYDDECYLEDHIGYKKGAIRKAQKYANEHNQEVFVNLDEDIIDVVYPD